MASRRSRPSDEEDDEDDRETARRHHREMARRSHERVRSRAPVRRWSDEEDDEDDDREEDHRRGRRGSEDLTSPPSKTPVYFRARDSVYFEPLVALAIIVVLLVGLFAYTQNWPPMYVVESDSMQHGSTDQIGLVNTGDLVLAQKVSMDQITTYEAGARTGYSTYGEYGDVVLYHPNGQTSVAPIIHRAITLIVVNANSTYSFPDLAGQPCGAASNAIYAISSTPTGCGTSAVGAGTLTLFHVGWRSVTVSVDLSSLGSSTGYLTMGDNNFDSVNGSVGNPDQPYLSTLVDPGWVVGVARGMLPWFGSLKLLLDGNSGEVPAQSWEWLGLSVVGLVLVALGVHYLLREAGVEDERRKAEEAEARRGRREEATGRWHWPHPLRTWAEDEDGEGDEDELAKHRGKTTAAPRRSWLGGGRPKPEVGRAPRRRAKAHRGDDDDESL